ncbi:SCO family protein [Azotobacter chroococcum]|uniref:Protein SCO1/2 n=1 Tax=Azotobacter chroococcum TaxID=353 RepID=A0A4R1PUW3_9GAMM|nr:SCO family protein [Azotobacter chroococcum]TBV98778.1 SCO family protein [Azotobacter chroococcum]TCL34587.1 protein SCO1/2 [Azotobacter chroococcum]
MQRLQAGLARALCVLLAMAGTLQAGATEEHAGHPLPQTRAESTRVRFAEVPLSDQHGRQLRLADAVGERIVVMGFVYTSCTTVCPVISAIMQKVQAQLGERAGAEVGLLSISVDPLRDTPARLLEYSRAYQSGPGWRWLTGEAAAVDEVLRGLGVRSADFTSHPPTLLVGDARSGQWTRYYGFTDPAVLLARIEMLAEAREHAGHGHMARHATQEGRP